MVYTIGGWNVDYLNSVHVIDVNPATGDLGAWANATFSLMDARADHACAEAHGWPASSSSTTRRVRDLVD